MHALRHAHRLLVPHGTLVDLHPITQERVETHGRTLGTIQDLDYLVNLPNAEESLARTTAAGLYELEAETDFDVLQHFDRIDDLLDTKREFLADQPALERRIRALAEPPMLREHCVLRRLRAC